MSDAVDGWEALGTRTDVGGHAIWWCDLAPTADPTGDPVLVLHGFPSSSFDWRHVIAVLPMTAKLLEARPDARLTVLDGVGHYPMIEAPDRFGPAVAAGFR